MPVLEARPPLISTLLAVDAAMVLELLTMPLKISVPPMASMVPWLSTSLPTAPLPWMVPLLVTLPPIRLEPMPAT